MALITDKKNFNIGLLLGISFLIVLGCIVSPLFNGQTGLEYADSLFNSLSKGSTYFIPDLAKQSETYDGQVLEVTLKAKTPEETEKYATLFSAAGAEVEITDNSFSVTGDLGGIIQSALADADVVFHEQPLTEKYGYDTKEAMYYWWNSFKQIDKELIHQGKFIESSFVKNIITKGLEPAYNFFGMEPLKVAERTGLVTFLFIFYIIYTVWWGFAIYFLFEGIGITMSASKEKKEA